MTTSADAASGDSQDLDARKPRVRMSGSQRREQLVAVGRKLFAAKGFRGGERRGRCSEGAEVSKPVVYDFGGKGASTRSLSTVRSPPYRNDHGRSQRTEPPRRMLESAALGMLTYIENSTDGFRILVRDSPPGTVPGSFASTIQDIAEKGRGAN